MNYYSNEYPNINELILVMFYSNLQNDGIFKGKVIEYPNYECIMNYQDATKKKKVNSWNKIISLNKNIVVNVDNIDINKKIIQVSTTYLNEHILSSKSLDNIQSQLLIYFQENKLLTQFMTTLCLVNNYDYKYLWETFVYYLDKIVKNENYTKSIWCYFNENINNLNIWLSELNMESYLLPIMNLFNKKHEFIIQKIITRFGIVNTDSIENIQQVFNNVLSNITFNYTLKYESTPYYIFQSNTCDSNIDNHNEFIDIIKSHINNNNTFIKIDYVGKII